MKAVIFDMDGVLIDSEPLHFMADGLVLKELKIEASEEYLNRFVGYTNPAMWEEINKDYPLTKSIEELIALQMTIKLKHLDESAYKPIDGIVELLEELKLNQIPIGIASSSPKIFIEAVIKKIGIKHYFSKWLSGEEVVRSKPEPDVFLGIAQLLNVNPQDCIVIEDSRSGTIAAKRAGMKCIGYKNMNSGNQDLSQADWIVDEISEIKYEKMKQLWV